MAWLAVGCVVSEGARDHPFNMMGDTAFHVYQGRRQDTRHTTDSYNVQWIHHLNYIHLSRPLKADRVDGRAAWQHSFLPTPLLLLSNWYNHKIECLDKSALLR